jgi:uncharacterized membrane protein YeaQ/YmgE (transglycosylase-associated protein family)
LLIWAAVGAIAGALACALRSEKNELNGGSKGAVLIIFATTGALISSAIYVTLAATLYKELPFSF